MAKMKKKFWCESAILLLQKIVKFGMDGIDY